MHKTLAIKLGIVLGLTVGLAIPLEMVNRLANERAARQEAVIDEIAASSAGAQRLVGPLLVLPYQEQYTEPYLEQETSDGENKLVRRTRSVKIDGKTLILPTRVDMTLQSLTSVKRRGLFKAPVFELDGQIEGRFLLPAEPPVQRQRADSRIHWGVPYLSLGLSDPRGIARAPQLMWGDTALEFAQGSELGPTLPQGIHAPLPALWSDAPAPAREIPFRLTLALRGTDAMRVVPLADSTRIALESTWPHPSFQGRFLPNADSLRISAAGFSAVWEVSALATAAPTHLRADLSAGRACQAGCADWFGVRFIAPVNVYSMVDRSVKYGLLFIGLTFAAFVLFELLHGLKIHPAQYLLVGLALALFFLLLLSLSEHVPFAFAYASATLACASLQGYYLSAVLGSLRRGVGFALVLGGLFAALYGLLMSEDAALLLGSLLLFALLALTMALTRRLDWYALEARLS